VNMVINVGDKLELSLPDGYYFLFSPTMKSKIMGVTTNSVLSNEDKNALFNNFPSVKVGDSLTFDYYVESKPVIVEHNYKLPLTVYNAYTSLNISIYVNDVIAVADTIINAGDKVEFVSNGDNLFTSLKGLNSKTGLTDTFVINSGNKRALLSSFPA